MRRLWERSVSDDDFLEVRLGKGNLPLATEVVLPKTAVGSEINPQLESAQRIVGDLKTVKGIAVAVAVKKTCTIGIVGNRQVAVKAMQNCVVQLTTQHSYTELNLIIISSERDYEQWSWTRWLPHMWDSERQIHYLSSDKKQAAELLGHFEDVLKRRDTVANERFHGQIMLPYFVFLITDYTLVENREFLKLLSSMGIAGGASAFLLFDSISKLPKECDLIVDFNNTGGSLYSRANSAYKTAFALDSFNEYEKFARAMAPIRDRSAVRNTQLPSSVTFFQGFGIKDASEIQILQNWSSARPHKSLAAPIGTKENGKPFLFDIHEKAHGPHGLVAGTTGSGKSEVLQTWILSVCAYYSPQDVSFILITNGSFDRATPNQRIKDLVIRALRGEDYSRGALFFRTIRGAEGGWHESALTRLFDHGTHRFYA
jgi:S-DNA-T family DNA segregation ATPase FtsK/SpoIIIE